MIVDFSFNLPDDLLFFWPLSVVSNAFYPVFFIFEKCDQSDQKKSVQLSVWNRCSVRRHAAASVFKYVVLPLKKIENTLTSGKYGLRMALPVLL